MCENKAKCDNPVHDEFLRFLVRFVISPEECLQTLDDQLVRHLRELTSGVEIDLDAQLAPDDD